MTGRFHNAGFSLIEIMVSMSILVIIVLIMAQLFHQSSIAWDSGLRKAEGNLSARAVVGFMSREIQSGVLLATNHPYFASMGGTIGTEELGSIKNGASIRFFTFTGTNSTINRTLKLIHYELSGGEIKRLEESCSTSGGVLYGKMLPGRGWVGLIDKVKTLEFETPDGNDYTTNMPAWVKIKIGTSRSDDVSGVSCMSAGPDRKFNTPDDITSK